MVFSPNYFFLFSYYIKMNSFAIDPKEILVRIFKYIFEGLIVAIAAYLIPGKKLAAVEILTIALVAAASFSVLDLFSPAFSASARAGAGFGIGAGLVNFPGNGLTV
jgi:hypothetical protein